MGLWQSGKGKETLTILTVLPIQGTRAPHRIYEEGMGWYGPMREDQVGENWLATKKKKLKRKFWRLSGRTFHVGRE